MKNRHAKHLSAILLLVVSTQSISTYAQDENKPLKDGEGYLLVAISMTHMAINTMSIDGGGSVFYAHDFRAKDLKPGINYKVIKLPEGDYYWRKIRLADRSYFNFDESEYPLNVKAGHINYGGLYVGEHTAGRRASFSLLNRASAAIEFLEECCQHLTAKYPIRYGGTDADPFLSYYFSLPEDVSEDAAESSPDEDSSKTVGDLLEEMKGETLEESLTAEFMKTDKFLSPKISPDGRLVSVLESMDDFHDLVVIDPINRTKLRVISEDRESGQMNFDIRQSYWVDNENLVFTFVVGRLDRMGLARIVKENGNPIDVEISLLGDNWYMIDPLPNTARKAQILRVSEGTRTLRVVDVTDADGVFMGATTSKLQSIIRKTGDWLIDGNGRVRVAIELDDKNLSRIVWYRRSDSNKWRKIWEGDPDVTFDPVMVMPDNRTLVVISNEQTDNAILTTYDRSKKTYGEPILEIPGRDVDYAMVNSARTEVIRVEYAEQGIIRHKYIGEKYTRLAESLNEDTYGSSPYVIDMNVGEEFAVVQTSTNDDPGAYYLFDIENALSYRFGSLRPWLAKFRLGKSQTILTTSDDGLQIESYLTLPDKDSYPEPPLIVMPHGGPISVRDLQHFNSRVQLLSNLGYAVLQTNYRGSSGFGKAFQEKGQGQWGRQIEDDIELAVQAALDLNVVDSDKLCIYGGSYGGYSALISAIRRPELYKCAASFAGVTDMNLMFHAFRANNPNIIRAAFLKIVGNPDEDLDSLVLNSPVYNADKIDVPIFLSHGLEDLRVDPENFYRMQTVLERFGKSAEYLILRNEAHGLQHLSSQKIFYRSLDRFFRNSMGLPDASLEKVLREDATWPELESE